MAELTKYQKAALDYSKHISLTANAGSGKTFVLSKRYVEIALNENIPLSKMVAITFTDKSAGELYRKIASETESGISVETDPAKKKILERIRRQLVSANISTIHSFCINLLRSFPVEASVDAGFVPVDQNTADELIDQSIEKYINDSLNDDKKFSQIKFLIRLLGSKQNLTGQLKYLAGKRKKMLRVIRDIYSGETEEIAGFFKQAFEKTAGEILGSKPDDFFRLAESVNSSVLASDPGNKYANEVIPFLAEYISVKTITEKLRILGSVFGVIFTQGGTVRSAGYLKKTKAEEITGETELLNEFAEDLSGLFNCGISGDADFNLAEFGKIFAEVYSGIISVYSEKKKHKSYLDFEDILIFAETLLTKEEVRKALSERFSFIMIDEYQDTDELQYNIFMPILDNLKKGNLFVVGDEKQSIYMFRDAELEIFSKTKNEINSAGSDSILNLPHTFRLYPEIALFTNNLFKNLFGNPNSKLNEVGYSELICARDPELSGKVEILLRDEDTASLSEAEIVALKILTEREGNPDSGFGKFTVLCRKRNHFEELEKTFSNHRIPYQIVGGKGFYQRQAVYDILNMLEFLLDQRNDTALTGILRSPFFNFPDEKIFLLFQRKGATLFEKLKIEKESDESVKNCVLLLDKFINISRSLDLNSLIRIILEETGYWSVAASGNDGQQEIANLKKIIAVASDFYRQGLKSLYDFIDFLKTSIDTLEDESQAAVSENESSVKIMTIHQSKGLEFENIFLYRCNDKPREDSVKSKTVTVNKDFGILTKVPVENDYSVDYETPDIVNLDNYISRKKGLAEQKRLLYVAITRAVKNLFICASHKEMKLTKNSFLDFIVTGLNIDLSKEDFREASSLKFLINSDEGLKDEEMTRELKIKIIQDSGEIRSAPDKVKFPEIPEIVNPAVVEDFPKGDIISATKVAVYSQCPLKYHLAYDLGLKKIEKYYKGGSDSFDFSGKEDEENSFGDIKGTIIHSILESEPEPGKAEEIVERKIEHFSSEINARSVPAEKVKYDVLTDLRCYFNSPVYSEIKSYKNSRNEFEIYTAEGDNYLFGIIDKLVIENERLLIIDYKTDNITADQVGERIKGYENQLTFYAFIVARLFPWYKNISYRLVFLKHPGINTERKLPVTDIFSFGEKLNRIIKNIRTGNFPPDKSHCSKCYFALNRKDCIFLKAETRE